MIGHYVSSGWQAWMFIAMWIWPVLLGLAVWTLVALTRDRPAMRANTAADDAKEMLKRRFASGEISRKDYFEAVDILENGSSRASRR